MEAHELTGYYTYRSFFDNPLPINDFNLIKSAEAELYLTAQADGAITGTLSFPADPGGPEKLFMDITGRIKSWSSPLTLEFEGKGRPNTSIFDHLYQYSCSVNHRWDNGQDQRLALAGTLLRSQDHGPDNEVAKAGSTASFIAVKRDFVEPRDTNGVAIIPSALSMLASRSHRLKHTVWHTARGVWNDLKETSKAKIHDLGWGVDRPPFTREGALDLSNGAGEDFLFMHRKMLAMVRHEYSIHKVPPIESWKILPRPNAQQFSYLDQDDPTNPGKIIYRFDPLSSGNQVPPAQPNDTESLKFLKSPDFFRLVMAQLERQFRNPRYLSALSLGALGNLLEFTIHNQMHMRWSSISRDPVTGEPALRDSFDFDTKWDNPKYDYLGDFHSSHVNPLFWRLHGWVDERIEDWFNAHEGAQPGEIERYDHQGIAWFKPGKWVQVHKPYYWPEGHHPHHNHNANDELEVDNMLKVMEIIIADLTSDQAKAADIITRHRVFGITSFMRAIELVG
jgi:hypothetical protein